MDYVYLVLVLASLLFYSLLPLFWLARHMLRLRYGKAMSRGVIDATLVVLFVLLALSMYAISYDYLPLKNDMPPYAAPLGWLLIIGALAIEGWSLYLLNKRVGSKKSSAAGPVMTGPYAYVRHPIYLAQMALNFGIYLATGALIPLLVFAEWLFLIKPLADVEDEELALRLEERYLEYKEKVPQLLPKIG
ncbi:Phospholipid methyltransferase [uncultured archaeon]|nr:Phospholipid methyltransferase [uncultured archaeon]